MELNMRKTVYKSKLCIAALLTIVVADGALSQNIDTATIGYLMKVKLDNYGTMGRYAYKEGEAAALRAGKVGLEYPIGQPYEHLFGSGVWIGGLLDTSASGGSAPVRGVSVAYEGWSGPYHEFFPGNTPMIVFGAVVSESLSLPDGTLTGALSWLTFQLQMTNAICGTTTTARASRGMSH